MEDRRYSNAVTPTALLVNTPSTMQPRLAKLFRYELQRRPLFSRAGGIAEISPRIRGSRTQLSNRKSKIDAGHKSCWSDHCETLAHQNEPIVSCAQPAHQAPAKSEGAHSGRSLADSHLGLRFVIASVRAHRVQALRIGVEDPFAGRHLFLAGLREGYAFHVRDALHEPVSDVFRRIFAGL